MHLNTPSLLWFLAGVVLFLLELSMPGFVLFFFALGAWVTALAAWLYPLGLDGQILLFIIASLGSLVALRRVTRRMFAGRKGNERQDNMVAETGTRVVVVADIIPPAEGRVKYSGSTWRARARVKIAAGEVAEVIEQDGLLITVRRVEDGEL